MLCQADILCGGAVARPLPRVFYRVAVPGVAGVPDVLAAVVRLHSCAHFRTGDGQIDHGEELIVVGDDAPE